MNTPQRHGCLTAWLYLMLIGGTFGLIGLMFLSQGTPPRPGYHPPSSLDLSLIAACTVVGMICAGGLFFLKRWGFYVYLVSSFALVWINFKARMDAGHALVPLISVLFLIGVMQIGGRYKAWGRLR